MSLPPPPYPRGPRVALREFLPEDNVAWQRIGGDPLVAVHAPWPPVTTRDAASAWLNETRRRAALTPRLSFYLAIEQYETDLVGVATLDVVSIPHRQGEIGCYLRPDRWREGLGTEVTRLLLELAFTRLGLHRVQASVDPGDVAARRVLDHVAMRHEGTFFDRYFIAGRWRDRAVHAVTMPEWRGQPLRGTAAVVADGAADAAADVAADVAASTDVPAQVAPSVPAPLVVPAKTSAGALAPAHTPALASDPKSAGEPDAQPSGADDIAHAPDPVPTAATPATSAAATAPASAAPAAAPDEA